MWRIRVRKIANAIAQLHKLALIQLVRPQVQTGEYVEQHIENASHKPSVFTAYPFLCRTKWESARLPYLSESAQREMILFAEKRCWWLFDYTKSAVERNKAHFCSKQHFLEQYVRISASPQEHVVRYGHGLYLYSVFLSTLSHHDCLITNLL